MISRHAQCASTDRIVSYRENEGGNVCGVEGEASHDMATARGSRQEQPKLSAAGESLERVRIEAVQSLLEEFDCQLEMCIKRGDQTEFCKHLNAVDFEGKQSCGLKVHQPRRGQTHS